jgi:glucose-6-phosphate 1-dehydrogenase
MTGDHTLFVREDSVDRAWQVIQPVLDAPPEIHPYPGGSWGPPEANALVEPGTWHLR